MLNDFLNTPFGEMVFFAGILSCLVMIGLVPAIYSIRKERKAPKWVFNTNIKVQNTTINSMFDKNSKEAVLTVETHPVKERDVFETSDIEGLEGLVDKLEILAEDVNAIQNSSLIKAKEKVSFFIGDKTADVITSCVTNIGDGEQVICGNYCMNTNEIEFEDVRVPLSTSELIGVGDGEFLLIKGNMLPNGLFHVIHWDDPENYEAGYGQDDFAIDIAV